MWPWGGTEGSWKGRAEPTQRSLSEGDNEGCVVGGMNEPSPGDVKCLFWVSSGWSDEVFAHPVGAVGWSLEELGLLCHLCRKKPAEMGSWDGLGGIWKIIQFQPLAMDRHHFSWCFEHPILLNPLSGFT